MKCRIKTFLKLYDVDCEYQKETCGFCRYLAIFVHDYKKCAHLKKEKKEEKDAMSQAP